LDTSQIVRVPDALTGRVAVETGVVDGLALSAITIRWMTLQDQLGRTEMAQPFEQENLTQYQYLGYGAVAFRQEDKQLRIAWNTALKDFIGSPEHLNLMNTFGFSLQELPGMVTTQEILSLP
jgi:polar amino acid transport system substrate-binding protein